MRANSPTGGALGQVSDLENKLLQAVQGALDPLQSKQLVENLQNIKQLYAAVMEERRRAFQHDYGGMTQQQPQMPGGQSAPAPAGGIKFLGFE